MNHLTAPELSAIRNQLQTETSLAERYLRCAKRCTDPQLKTRCESIAARHREHCQTLLTLLGEGAMRQ